MKLAQYILVLTIMTILTSCTSKKARLFSAFDEIHYIILYEEDNEFELLYNGHNTAIGKYSLTGDTIFLTYKENQFEEFDPNEKLTRILLIENDSKRVKSIDDRMQFCANIDLDKRENKTGYNKTYRQ